MANDSVLIMIQHSILSNDMTYQNLKLTIIFEKFGGSVTRNIVEMLIHRAELLRFCQSHLYSGCFKVLGDVGAKLDEAIAFHKIEEDQMSLAVE